MISEVTTGANGADPAERPIPAKSAVQKRIDKLVRENHELLELALQYDRTVEQYKNELRKMREGQHGR